MAKRDPLAQFVKEASVIDQNMAEDIAVKGRELHHYERAAFGRELRDAAVRSGITEMLARVDASAYSVICDLVKAEAESVLKDYGMLEQDASIDDECDFLLSLSSKSSPRATGMMAGTVADITSNTAFTLHSGITHSGHEHPNQLFNFFAPDGSDTHQQMTHIRKFCDFFKPMCDMLELREADAEGSEH